MILALCDRFHCLPSQIENEDASLLYMLQLEEAGTRKEVYDGE
jgi:hypothetical protein